MPGKVKVRICEARGLPVMDRSSDLADAFAEVKFGNIVYKTDVYKKSLNPKWNSDWYRFEVDDEELQEEPLQLRVMDYDTYSAHDAIGKVNISLNCLLTHDAPSSMTGWFPIYDTMHGIRGEINIIVKVDFFVDANKFRQSSCGVQFFTTPSVPSCYQIDVFHGFIEELVVNDDPEYQWIDNFRTPRSSNEARQRLFQKLSGELQRKLGLKVIDLGGNAVIGYQQYFDLEGESGIVVRGIGTCVFLIPLRKMPATSNPATPTAFSISPRDSSGTAQELFMQHDPAKSFPPVRQKRRTSSSDSDTASPLKDSSGSGDTVSLSELAKMARQSSGKQRNIDEFEYPFFTLTKFPAGFLRNIGGVVSARSVKLLDRISNPDEPETRDSWWAEIRTEIRSHANALGCHAVVGYSESTTICDELIVLSASGTAACVQLEKDPRTTVRMIKNLGQGSLSSQTESESITEQLELSLSTPLHLSLTPTDDQTPMRDNVCSVCHVPYSENEIPMPVHLTKCFSCKQAKVPDVLFTTIEMPEGLQTTGRGCLLQGRVCRRKRKDKGEANAELISNTLPFLEYELHLQLTNKLKVKGMNALFGLQIQITTGEVMIIAVATATAVYLSCLPPPPILRVAGKSSTTDEDRSLKNIQKKILDVTNKNRIRYGLGEIGDLSLSCFSNYQGMPVAEPEEVFDYKAGLDPALGGREAFVVEVDDKQDEDVITFLFDPPPPEGFYCGTTDVIPGVTQPDRRMQMVTAVRRVKISDDEIGQNQSITKLLDGIIKSFWFKLRRLSPCSISNMQFDLEIPMADNVQVAVSAYVVALSKQHCRDSPVSHRGGDKGHKTAGLLKVGKTGNTSLDYDELQFQIDEVSSQTKSQDSSSSGDSSQLRLENRMKLKLPQLPFRPKVEITPMFSVPGGTTERHLGNVNLFFIRESLSIRENGGLNFFIQMFIGEVHAVLRAHVLALGGNALISFRMNKIVLLDSPHKNQGQMLLNVCGDVVEVSYKEPL